LHFAKWGIFWISICNLLDCRIGDGLSEVLHARSWRCHQ
jgi:hypothetical protein